MGNLEFSGEMPPEVYEPINSLMYGVNTVEDFLRPPDDGTLAKLISPLPSGPLPKSINPEKFLQERRAERIKRLDIAKLFLDRSAELVPA